MRDQGAPQEAIDDMQAKLATEDEAVRMELPADCRLAVAAFFAVDTQWNKLVAGERLIATGLNYAGVRAALDELGFSRSPALFADLRLMEGEALLAMAERR